MKDIAIIVLGVLAAAASAALFLGVSYLGCTGYTGHTPVSWQPLVTIATFYGVLNAVRAGAWVAKEWDK